MKIPSTLSEWPHRRLNLLTGEWVVVSPHRTERPWQGQTDKVPAEPVPQYDPNCYLCPGNQRAGGARNPEYTSTFVFDNDYPALLPKTSAAEVRVDDVIVAQPERGICRVACFSPRHDLTLASMAQGEIAKVIQLWREQFDELGAKDFIRYVQVFENRGIMMGASNPHPHCQIWATESIPNEAAREHASLKSYAEKHDNCLLCDYARRERGGERVVWQNASFTAVVPFWAVWPFEILVVSQRHTSDLTQLATDEVSDLAGMLQKITRCYDRLFQTPFPYSMGFHQRPSDRQSHPYCHLHAHFYPPLLRSAEVRKFMVGFEMLGSPQRDITPESAAARLRQLVER